ncbi:aldehyde dehydrogenase family protein [Pacificibacter sp. AS14]|uniref:aldehyde dehydrogenase family protein n=1 Tax=Pacificibacter sp. AS14 TaxID=3135785 RepID=UPI00317544AC
MFVARFGHVDKQCAIPKTSPEILDAKALRAYTFYLVAYLLAGARPYIGATTRRCWRYFDAEVVQVVLGDTEVAAAFSNLPFDHLLFTDSTAVGRKVAMAAAQNLTLVTLELGGQIPNRGHAICRFGSGRAPDHLGHYSQSGASLRGPRLCLGAACSDGNLRDNQRKYAPALVIDPPLDCAIMRDEIFGPVLPILPYDTAEQALSFVNERDRPLALYVFAQDKSEQDLWLERSMSGGVTVNDTVIHVAVDSLLFGGVGASGYGVYHGKAGFETFSHMKPVLRQAKWNAMSLTEPPMTGVKKRLMKLVRKLM